MTKSKAKLEWGEAKREVIALMPEIDTLLADGHTRKSAYNTFVRDNRISCNYRTFCRWLDRYSDEHPKPNKSQVQTKKTTSVASPPCVSKSQKNGNRKKASTKTGPVIARSSINRFND